MHFCLFLTIPYSGRFTWNKNNNGWLTGDPLLEHLKTKFKIYKNRNLQSISLAWSPIPLQGSVVDSSCCKISHNFEGTFTLVNFNILTSFLCIFLDVWCHHSVPIFRLFTCNLLWVFEGCRWTTKILGHYGDIKRRERCRKEVRILINKFPW